MSSKNLPKYEHLTGEDLGFEPGALEQARFEYSPLGKIFKRLTEDTKKGFEKRLRNIEGKNEEQLKAIEDQGNKHWIQSKTLRQAQNQQRQSVF